MDTVRGQLMLYIKTGGLYNMAILGLAARKNREIAGWRSPESGVEDMCL